MQVFAENADRPSLAEVQRLLWRAVRHQPLPDGYEQVFTLPQGADLEERLVLYRDMYWNRQVGALLELLEDTCAVVGLATFTPILVNALSALPSVHPAMEHLPARILPHIEAHSGLPESSLSVLRFEVAMLDALVAPSAMNLLEALPSDVPTLMSMRFALIPGASVVAAPDSKTLRLVARSGERAVWWPIQASDARLFDRMQGGATLEVLCDVAVLELGAAPEEAMAQVAKLLMMLLPEKLLCYTEIAS